MASPALLTRLIALYALKEGLPDPQLAVAVATQESALNPNAVGDNGKSLGLFQLQRAAAQDAGIDPERRGELRENIRGGVRYLKQQLDREGGNVERALSRYNRGTPTYKGIGDPRYVEHVMEKYTKGPARSGVVARLGRALTPATAEAAEPSGPPGALRAEDRAALESRLQQLKAARAQLAAGTPSPVAASVPSPPLAEQEAQATQQALYGTAPARPGAAAQAGAPALAAPAASPATAVQRTPEGGIDYNVYLPPPELPTGRNLGAMGVTTATGLAGRGLGTLAAPLAGPLAPAMPLIGEAVGSYVGRRLNVATGLEDPGGLGDVVSVAGPLVTGGRQAVQGLRTGTAPATVPTRAAERVAQAQEAGVPLTYGEAVDAPMARRTETLLEQVPLLGTGGFRQRQQEAVKQAAQARVDAQQTVMKQTPWNGLPQVQAAAARGNKQAQQVLDQVAQAGDDWTKIVQASGNMKAFRSRQIAGRLYDRVAQLAEPLGQVPMTKTLATIDDTLKTLRQAVVPDTETIRYLEQMQTGLKSQTSTTVSPLLNATGQPITSTVTTPGKTTYGQLRAFRSDLGDTISDYYRGSNAVIGAKGVGSLAKVRSALDQDLDTFALQSPSPELAAAAKQADTFYKLQVVPFEDPLLAKALTSDTPDEIYGKFIQRGHRDRAQKFYTALDARGKAAVQYGMIADAQEKALDPTTGAFSPKKFASSLEGVQDATGVFFTGQEKWKLDGFLKVMRAAERAGAYAENPPTGQRVIPFLLGGGAVTTIMAGAGPAATAAVSARGLSWLLASRSGTALLLRAHRAAEDSFAMRQVLTTLTREGTRILGTEMAQGLQEGQQVPVTPGRLGP